VKTALYCEHCGKQCGTARRGDDIGMGFDGRDVMVDGKYHTGEKFHSTADDNIGMAYSNTARRDGWPMQWPCPSCGWSVRLEHAASRQIGMEKQLVVPASPSSTR
jgi:hypothetical protein